MGSDGTADALYCQPHIAILWLQWRGQTGTACAPCPGIKAKVTRQSEESKTVRPQGTEQELTLISIIISLVLCDFPVVCNSKLVKSTSGRKTKCFASDPQFC